jgi:hypothetical protein
MLRDYAGEGRQHIKRQTRPLIREGAQKNKIVTVKE